MTKRTRISFLLTLFIPLTGQLAAQPPAMLISTSTVFGQQTATGGSAPADIVYTRPGQLFDVGGFRLNLYCMGSRSPSVVSNTKTTPRSGLLRSAAASMLNQARSATSKGFVAATRGNHDQSLVFAAKLFGMGIIIVVPKGNSKEKNAAMMALGATLMSIPDARTLRTYSNGGLSFVRGTVPAEEPN